MSDTTPSYVPLYPYQIHALALMHIQGENKPGADPLKRIDKILCDVMAADNATRKQDWDAAKTHLETVFASMPAALLSITAKQSTRDRVEFTKKVEQRVEQFLAEHVEVTLMAHDQILHTDLSVCISKRGDLFNDRLALPLKLVREWLNKNHVTTKVPHPAMPGLFVAAWLGVRLVERPSEKASA